MMHYIQVLERCVMVDGKIYPKGPWLPDPDYLKETISLRFTGFNASAIILQNVSYADITDDGTGEVCQSFSQLLQLIQNGFFLREIDLDAIWAGINSKITNQTTALENAKFWIESGRFENAVYTPQVDGGYGGVKLRSGIVYGTAVDIVQDQPYPNGGIAGFFYNNETAQHLNIWGSFGTSLGPGLGNYFSRTAVYSGYAMGVGTRPNGSFGIAAYRGSLIFHADQSDRVLSICGKVTGVNNGPYYDLDATSGFMVDKDDRVYLHGTANADKQAGGWLVSLDQATGQLAKTRSVAKYYTPISTADPTGEDGEVAVDNDYAYYKVPGIGWLRGKIDFF